MSGLDRTLKNRNELTSYLRHKFRRDLQKGRRAAISKDASLMVHAGAAVSEPETGTDALAPPARR
jgi:hypothetical protein